MHVSSKTGETGTCFESPKGNSRSSGNRAKTLSRLAYKRFTIFLDPRSGLSLLGSVASVHILVFLASIPSQRHINSLCPGISRYFIHVMFLDLHWTSWPNWESLALGLSTVNISTRFDGQKRITNPVGLARHPRIDVYTPSSTGRSHVPRR